MVPLASKSVETHVAVILGVGEPKRGKPSQDFKGGASKVQLTETTSFINHLSIPYLAWSWLE